MVSDYRILVFCGAWASVVLAPIACALEISASGTVELTTALIAMVPIHAIIVGYLKAQ